MGKRIEVKKVTVTVTSLQITNFPTPVLNCNTRHSTIGDAQFIFEDFTTTYQYLYFQAD